MPAVDLFALDLVDLPAGCGVGSADDIFRHRLAALEPVPAGGNAPRGPKLFRRYSSA
jgi:hypothetical protein